MQKKPTEDELKSLELEQLIESVTDSSNFDLDARDRAMQDFKRNGRHSWIQRGIEISCNICPNHHGFFVTPDIMLTGIDENGNPILDKIT